MFPDPYAVEVGEFPVTVPEVLEFPGLGAELLEFPGYPALIFFADAGYRAAVMADGPRAYFPMDETSGSVFDIVAGVEARLLGNSGTREVPYPDDTAREFTGGGAYYIVDPEDATGFAWKTGNYSAEWWSLSDSHGNQGFWSQRISSATTQGISVFTGTSGAGLIVSDVGPGKRSTFSDYTIPIGEWVHYVFTYDHSTGARRLYANGEPVGYNTNQGIDLTLDPPLIIGILGGNQSYSMDGAMAHLSFFDKVLTPEQVRTHFLAGPLQGAGVQSEGTAGAIIEAIQVYFANVVSEGTAGAVAFPVAQVVAGVTSSGTPRLILGFVGMANVTGEGTAGAVVAGSAQATVQASVLSTGAAGGVVDAWAEAAIPVGSFSTGTAGGVVEAKAIAEKPATATGEGTAGATVEGKNSSSPMRMNKNGSWNSPTNSTTKIPGWVVDAAYGGTQIVDDGLVVNVDGPVTATLSITRGGGNTSDQIRIYKNGVSVATSGNLNFTSTATATWSGTVVPGDRLEAYFQNGGSFTQTPVNSGYLKYELG